MSTSNSHSRPMSTTDVVLAAASRLSSETLSKEGTAGIYLGPNVRKSRPPSQCETPPVHLFCGTNPASRPTTPPQIAAANVLAAAAAGSSSQSTSSSNSGKDSSGLIASMANALTGQNNDNGRIQFTQHVKNVSQAVLPGIIKGTGTGVPSSQAYYGAPGFIPNSQHANVDPSLGGAVANANNWSGNMTAPRVAVFWDFENCPPPTGMPGYVVVENIRRAVHTFGCVTLFKAYLEISEQQAHKKNLRSELQSSGVSLTDCPHNGRKDAADKMILVDMLAFALDNPSPATIVLISGDRDFVYALSTLRNRRYTVVLIVPNRGAHIILKSQANAILEWRYDVLNQDIEVLKEMGMLDQDEYGKDTANTTALSRPSSNYGRDRPAIRPTVIPHADRGRATPGEESTGKEEGAQSSDWRDRHTERVGSLARNLSRQPSGISTPVAQHVHSRSASPSRALEEQAENAESTRDEKGGKSDPDNKMPIATPQPMPAMFSQSSEAMRSASQSGHVLPRLAMTSRRSLLLDDEDDIPQFSPRVPHFFDILIEVLELFRLEGDVRPRRSKVGNELVRRNPLLYNRAGVENFKDYVELAYKEGLVELGGEKGMAWITLADKAKERLFK